MVKPSRCWKIETGKRHILGTTEEVEFEDKRMSFTKWLFDLVGLVVPDNVIKITVAKDFITKSLTSVQARMALKIIC